MRHASQAHGHCYRIHTPSFSEKSWRDSADLGRYPESCGSIPRREFLRRPEMYQDPWWILLASERTSPHASLLAITPDNGELARQTERLLRQHLPVVDDECLSTACLFSCRRLANVARFDRLRLIVDESTLYNTCRLIHHQREPINSSDIRESRGFVSSLLDARCSYVQRWGDHGDYVRDLEGSHPLSPYRRLGALRRSKGVVLVNNRIHKAEGIEYWESSPLFSSWGASRRVPIEQGARVNGPTKIEEVFTGIETTLIVGRRMKSTNMMGSDQKSQEKT